MSMHHHSHGATRPSRRMHIQVRTVRLKLLLLLVGTRRSVVGGLSCRLSSTAYLSRRTACTATPRRCPRCASRWPRRRSHSRAKPRASRRWTDPARRAVDGNPEHKKSRRSSTPIRDGDGSASSPGATRSLSNVLACLSIESRGPCAACVLPTRSWPSPAFWLLRLLSLSKHSVGGCRGWLELGSVGLSCSCRCAGHVSLSGASGKPLRLRLLPGCGTSPLSLA